MGQKNTSCEQCPVKGHSIFCDLSAEGNEIIQRISKPGDILGHRCLYNHDQYQYTAIALEDSAACFIEKRFFLKNISKVTNVSLNIIQKLSQELHQAEIHRLSLTQKNVRERLAGLLLNLCANFGIQEEENRIRLDIILTREELASFVGTATETIIRFISELKDEEILHQEGKILFVTDLDKLRDFARVNCP